MSSRTKTILDRRMGGVAGGFALLLAFSGPAAAQMTNPLDWLFGKREPARAEAIPSTAAAPASAALTPARAVKPAQPSNPPQVVPLGQPGHPAAQQSIPLPATAVLPPKRPASFGSASADASPGTIPAVQAAPRPLSVPAAHPVAQSGPAPDAPVVTAAARTAVPAPAAPLTEREVVERANAYFNGISALVADFAQTGGDGRRMTGKLYLQKPGKMRFEYDAPATLEIISDGSSVAVRDRRLATQDLFYLSQTPLKFLLRERIDLGRDLPVTGVVADQDGVRIALEDKSTLGGASKITLFFDRGMETLTRWRIVDPQGFTTVVVLSNLDKTRRVDPRLFVINYERMLEDKR